MRRGSPCHDSQTHPELQFSATGAKSPACDGRAGSGSPAAQGEARATSARRLVALPRERVTARHANSFTPTKGPPATPSPPPRRSVPGRRPRTPRRTRRRPRTDCERAAPPVLPSVRRAARDLLPGLVDPAWNARSTPPLPIAHADRGISCTQRRVEASTAEGDGHGEALPTAGTNPADGPWQGTLQRRSIGWPRPTSSRGTSAAPLELALYRTYAVPSIGRLLAQTAEFTDRAEAVRRHEVASGRRRRAMASAASRAASAIGASTRCTAVTTSPTTTCGRPCAVTVVTKRAGSIACRMAQDCRATRPIASAVHYRTLGRHMGIKGIPGVIRGVRKSCLDAYEEAPPRLGRKGCALGSPMRPLDLTASWYRAPSSGPAHRDLAARSTSPSCGPSGTRRRAPASTLVRRAVRAAQRPRGRVNRRRCRPGAAPRTTPARTGDRVATRTATG